MNHWIKTCDDYLAERTGNYEQRAERYRRAALAMAAHGLTDDMTVVDMGAGWTEFDFCLRTEYNFRGRYIPVDGAIDGTNLDHWHPHRTADWYVALEILEHLRRPYGLLHHMMRSALKGVIFTTPNPRTTDVLGMDRTHITPIDANRVRTMGFDVTETTLYGGRFSNGEPDSLFGIWVRP